MRVSEERCRLSRPPECDSILRLSSVAGDGRVHESAFRLERSMAGPAEYIRIDKAVDTNRLNLLQK